MKRVTLNGLAHMREEVAGIVITSPPIPTEPGGFLNGHVAVKADQFWQRPADLPTDDVFMGWPEWKQNELAVREHARIRQGAWYLNNGVPTWLTGINYFFLVYYTMEGIHPYYKDSDRQYFWLWNWVEITPRIIGLYMHERRQGGKSHRANAVLLHAGITTKNVKIGIQSRDEDAAQELFAFKTVPAWQKLPAWLKPPNHGKPDPKEVLLFEEVRKNEAGKPILGADGKAEMGGLRSRIDFASSLPGAYDHAKLYRHLNDEVGKDQMYNPWKRHNQVKRQMIQPNPATGQPEVVGKMIATTSTDEEEKADPNARRNNGLMTAQKFWKNSDPALINWDNPYSQTPSGLVRYLRLADDGFLIDKYGLSLKAESRAYHQTQLDGMDSATEKLAYRRAHPLKEADAFMPDATECAFEAAVLRDAYEAAERWDGLRPYKFRETPNGRASLVPDENGPWWFVPEAIPRPDRQNKVEVSGQLIVNGEVRETLIPLQKNVYYLSFDPIHKDRDQLARVDQGSQAAAHIGWERDPDNERDPERPNYWPSGGFIGEYRHRPNKKDDCFEQMRLASIFFGCQALSEDSGSYDLDGYFKRHGCVALLAVPAKDTPGAKAKLRQTGLSNAGPVRNHRVKKLNHFVDERLSTDWRYLPLPRTLQDMMLFEEARATVFDLTSSASILATKLMPSNIRTLPPPATSVSSLAARLAF